MHPSSELLIYLKEKIILKIWKFYLDCEQIHFKMQCFVASVHFKANVIYYKFKKREASFLICYNSHVHNKVTFQD